jgi:hypothetical protein
MDHRSFSQMQAKKEKNLASKSEARNTKFETSTNFQNPNVTNESFDI